MSKLIDLTGKTFGKLEVKHLDKRWEKTNHSTYWWVKCACDVEKSVSARSLRKGLDNCGCDRYPEEPYKALYNMFKDRAERQGHSVDISFEQFLAFTNTLLCHYCDSPVKWNARNTAKGSAYNLDRKDNLLHYFVDNCVVCCTTCNRAKGSKYTYEEWKTMTEALKLYRKSLEVPSAS